jgi:GWxTD domain-containing protein
LIFGCSSGKNITKATHTQDLEETRPRFYAEYTNVLSEDTAGKAKLTVSLVAPRADLSFTTIRENGIIRYRAVVSWEVKLSFNDPHGKIKVSGADFVRREVIVNTYEETRLGVTVAESNFFVTPNADYRLEVLFTDEETGVSSKRIYPHVASRLIKGGDFNLADPIIFAATVIDSTKMAFVPLNSQRIDPWQKVSFLNVIYYPPKNEQIRLYYEIIGPNGEIVFQKDQFVPPTQKNWSFDTLFVELPDEAGNGNYSLHAMATSESGKAAGFTALKSFILYSIIPRSAKELDKAAEQMIYLQGAEAAIDSIIKNPTTSGKRRLLLDFWRRTDPDSVRAILLMKEYYKRVNYADKHFRSQWQEGWKTDPGKVYIRFGKPDQIDRNPFAAAGPPFEIWHYYRLPAKDAYYLRWFPYKFFVFVERFLNEPNFGDDDIYRHNQIEFENY